MSYQIIKYSIIKQETIKKNIPIYAIDCYNTFHYCNMYEQIRNQKKQIKEICFQLVEQGNILRYYEKEARGVICHCELLDREFEIFKTDINIPNRYKNIELKKIGITKKHSRGIYKYNLAEGLISLFEQKKLTQKYKFLYKILKNKIRYDKGISLEDYCSNWAKRLLEDNKNGV